MEKDASVNNIQLLKLSFKHPCQLSKEERTTSCDSIFAPANATLFQRFRLFLKKMIVVSPKNPRCYDYFRSRDSVIKHRNMWLQETIRVIHPLSMFRLYYEMYFGVIFLWCMFWFPFYASFRNESLSHASTFLNVMCGVDIFFTFCTGYMNDEEKLAVVDPLKIAKRYVLGSTFIFDVLTVISPGFIPNASLVTFQVFHLFGILKIVRITHTYLYITRTLKFLRINNRFTFCFRDLVFIFLFFHWGACFIYLTPQIRFFITGSYDFQTTGWHYSEHAPGYIYLKSLYLSTSLILCIKTEEWTLRPWEEYVVCILIRSFGKIGTLFISVVLVPRILAYTSLETKYQEIQKQLSGFMFKKQLPKVLRDKLNANYQYKYRGYFFQENKITYILSDQLKRDINAEVLSKLATNVSLFKFLPYKVLEAILSHLKLQIYLPNDLIVKSGVYGDCMYFVASGTVCVTTPSGREVCHLCDGDYFGEICLVFKDQKRTACVWAIETCEVYKLSKGAFRNCFKSNQQILQHIKEVAKQRMDATQDIEDNFLKERNDIGVLINK